MALVDLVSGISSGQQHGAVPADRQTGRTREQTGLLFVAGQRLLGQVIVFRYA